MSNFTTRRSVRALLLLAFGGAVCGVAILELGLRLAGISYPVFATSDKARGHALRPGASGWQSDEGFAYVRISSAGLRDREHALAKSARTLRIALLGDSYAEAMQVSMEHTFWWLMHTKLAACGGLQGAEVEIINFGVGGYGTAQELLTLRDQVWSYQPDVVLLAFTTGNDITDNLRELKRDPNVPYFLLENGKLVLDDSFTSASGYRFRASTLGRIFLWLVARSRTIQIVNHARYLWRQDALMRERKASVGSAIGDDNTVYRAPPTPEWVKAWEITDALVTQMASEVKAHGSRFVLLTLSNPAQIEPDPQTRERTQRELGVSDLFYPERRLQTLGAAQGFPVLSLAPELQRYAQAQQVNLHQAEGGRVEGHWNQAAHALVAEIAARELCCLLSSTQYNGPESELTFLSETPQAGEYLLGKGADGSRKDATSCRGLNIPSLSRP